RPMVITYRTSALTWAIGRRMLHVEHVGLPNLLAGRRLVPELLQEQATADRLGAAVLGQLDAPDHETRALQAAFEQIHLQLRQDASAQAAQVVLELATNGVPAALGVAADGQTADDGAAQHRTER
ncbi:MAG: hypothetical protein KDK91_33455, partial [Gammaproteobacteria bacterium]|nr:hypothetical protein [Gammaproteobacteria bacterium]